jgi:branched-chain amino acid transport system ATP-binding protein
MNDSAVILETNDLVKEFKGFVAVSGVSLKVKRGQIHALIGPNGAGKTTFFNLLTMVRSFQISAVFPHLSVLENVRVALQRNLGTSFYFWRSEKSLNRLNDRAMQLLAEVGLEQYAQAETADLSYGRKRALELATTLALEPELMLLDEPTQGMGHEDVSNVTQLIKKVSANRTVLMVEHNMKVISSIADTISVLERGAVIAEGPYAEVSQNPRVREAYMGTSDEQLGGVH